MAQIKRQVAIHTRISTLRNGEYIKQEGWDPNYILTKNQKKISRANIMAIVISEPNTLQIEVDDGSARLTVRQFDETVQLMHLKVGDPVLIIGRPREYERDIYLIPEIVKKLDNPEWLKNRQQQLPAEPLDAPKEQSDNPMQQQEGSPTKEGQSTTQATNTPNQEQNDQVIIPKQETQTFREQYEQVYTLIKQIDDGKGADIEQVLQSARFETAEQIIKQLILEGEVFELSPGMLKVLE